MATELKPDPPPDDGPVEIDDEGRRVIKRENGGLLARVIAALVDAHLEPVLLPQVDRQEAPHQAAAHHGGRPGGIMIQERGH